jgi:hypothetical protein
LTERLHATKFAEWLDLSGLSPYAVGQCLTLTANQTLSSFQLRDTEQADCTAAHVLEVFMQTEHPAPLGEPYPGDDAIRAFADQQCTGAFAGYVGQEFDSSSFDIYWFYPDSQHWKANTERSSAFSRRATKFLALGRLEAAACRQSGVAALTSRVSDARGRSSRHHAVMSRDAPKIERPAAADLMSEWPEEMGWPQTQGGEKKISELNRAAWIFPACHWRADRIRERRLSLAEALMQKQAVPTTTSCPRPWTTAAKQRSTSPTQATWRGDQRQSTVQAYSAHSCRASSLSRASAAARPARCR